MSTRKGIGHPRPSHNSVPEYQLSGIPFVTSSNGAECDNESIATRVKFPAVTRWIVLSCTGSSSRSAQIKFGFTSNGVTKTASSGSTRRYFVLKDGEKTERLEIRCKELFIAKHGSRNAGFNIIAGLTGVLAPEFPTLTGSTVDPVTGLPVVPPLMGGVG